MANNIKEMTREEVENAASNSHLLYSTIIKSLERGDITPVIQAKHQRVYIRKAIPNEVVFVPADNASYTATEGQYLVYNDATNKYLIDEKNFKKYQLDENLEKKVDSTGQEILGYKPKGVPVLTIMIDRLKDITLGQDGFTYFPSNWWGSSDTIKEGFMIVLPYDPTKTLAQNIIDYKKSFELFPDSRSTTEEIKSHLTSGKGFDCYAIDDEHVATYGVCDKSGTFKNEEHRAKANQTAIYAGQPDFQSELSKQE